MSEDTIFREVEEDLRADRMRNLWRRFGPYIIGGAVAVVLLVAVNEGWSWWQQTNAARSSDALYTALDAARSGDFDAAIKALPTVETEGSGQYPALAKFADASYLAAQGKAADAVALYDAIAGTSNEIRLRELALVLAAYQLVDSGDAAGVHTRVDGVIGSGSPFADIAREALGLTQYKAGDANGALATFEAITTNASASSDLLSRIFLYITQLKAEGAVSSSAAAS